MSASATRATLTFCPISTPSISPFALPQSAQNIKTTNISARSLCSGGSSLSRVSGESGFSGVSGVSTTTFTKSIHNTPINKEIAN